MVLVLVKKKNSLVLRGKGKVRLPTIKNKVNLGKSLEVCAISSTSQ